MATRRDTVLKQAEYLKENKKHKKTPFQQTHLRPPLRPANATRQGGQPLLTVTKKPPPTGHPNKICTADDRGQLKRPGMQTSMVHTKSAKLEAASCAGGISAQSRPPLRTNTQSRREQLELWRLQKVADKTKAAQPSSRLSHTSRQLKQTVVMTGPPSIHQKSRCATTLTNPASRKRPTPSLSALHVNRSLAPPLQVNQPCRSLLKQQPVIQASRPVVGKTQLQARSVNEKGRPLAAVNMAKRQTLFLGSNIDRKRPFISGSQLPSVKVRPMPKLPSNAASQGTGARPTNVAPRGTSARPTNAAPQGTGARPSNAAPQGTGARPSSPSRRKSKRFVHVKACVDSNLAAIRSQSRFMCSPRLKHTVVTSRGGNPRHSMPAHAKRTSVMGLNSRKSIGAIKCPSRMTCSPRLKHALVLSHGGKQKNAMPTHATRTSVMGLNSRKSFGVSRRSPRQVCLSHRTSGHQRPADKGVKFATPAKAASAWARSEVLTPACTPLQKEQSMREKLEVWLTSRGKTPSKYSHMMCFGHGHSTSQRMTTETAMSCQQHRRKQLRVTPGKSDRRTTFSLPDRAVVTDPTEVTAEVTDGQKEHECHPSESKALEGLLHECLQLLQEADCPAGLVEGWLREIGTIPQALHHAKFWIVKAKLAEASGKSNDAVVDIFEQAFRHKVQPPEEMAAALKGFVERMAKIHEDTTDAGGKTQDVQQNMFESTSVKYCMSNTTVFFKRVRSRLDVSPSKWPRAIITPVRRSTRKSLAALPSLLKEHDVIYDALEEVPVHLQPCTLFRTNTALEAVLDESVEM